jgi:hypothetical protein
MLLETKLEVLKKILDFQLPLKQNLKPNLINTEINFLKTINNQKLINKRFKS